ncbi:hypothetical protein TSAR_001642 [Trichomalopsis sarcophagae]|uniref:Small ribosomal subunit protein mS29 n=1 Tax=Trichomalopsis sarcophagae TaxID=543379 RepID=A0A232EZ99_9HYME|nr:hypothetical protein TSAR_001642 [Trichomalopsis sarcophagae]
MSTLSELAARLINATNNLRYTSTAAQPIQIQDELIPTFRTKENDPSKHCAVHLNRYYTIPYNEINTIFAQTIPGEYVKQNKTFQEMCLLIRKPAIEIMNCLSQTDYTKPVNKYILYGEDGCGKTSTLLHLIHYGYVTKKIIVNVQWASMWYRFPREVANSTTREGFVDLPIDAAAWLVNFKNQNKLILNQVDLKLSNAYEWSSQESSLKGSPLIELIDFGIQRVKYASDIVVALMSELKQASIAGKCKIMVAIDCYNAFFANKTNVKNDAKQKVPASKVTLTQAFLDITKSDWCNGEIILAVDQFSTQNQESYFPRYLLRKEGFDHLDPFLPIAVENYSTDEFDTVIEYYKNRKWIRKLSPEGQKELELVSGKNPYKLMEYCKNL